MLNKIKSLTQQKQKFFFRQKNLRGHVLRKHASELIFLLLLSVAATTLWSNIIWDRYEAVSAMADGKIPVTIVMYHSILKDPNRSGTYVITPDQLEEDVKYLVDNGYQFITMNDLINYVKIPWCTLPDKPVMLTFDDGYYNNYLYAYPIMKKYNASFVLSVIGKYTDINKEGEKLSPNYSHVTWEQIKEMDKSGLVEIQHHSYDLHASNRSRVGAVKLKSESEEEYEQFLKEDMQKFQKLLKEKTGIKTNTFTYPFGKISPQSVEILKELGFEATLSCYEGINYIGKGDDELLFHLKRYNRPSGRSSESFFRNKLK